MVLTRELAASNSGRSTGGRFCGWRVPEAGSAVGASEARAPGRCVTPPLPPADGQAAQPLLQRRERAPGAPGEELAPPAAHQGQDREGLLQVRPLELALFRKGSRPRGAWPLAASWRSGPRALQGRPRVCAQSRAHEMPSPGDQRHRPQDLM